jgi:hypothetical protein
MPLLQGIRDPRGVLLVTAAAAVLGVGGVGVAHAASDGDEPTETGYAVVTTADEAGPGGTARVAPSHEDCAKFGGWGSGGQGASPSESLSTGQSESSEAQL